MDFNYSQNANSTHIFHVNGDKTRCFNLRVLTDAISEIYQNSHSKPIYIVLNLKNHQQLPLQNLILDLKRFYSSVSQSSVFIALVLPPSLVSIVESTVKTLVSRKVIQNFEQEKTALLWLNIERKRLQSRSA